MVVLWSGRCLGLWDAFKYRVFEASKLVSTKTPLLKPDYRRQGMTEQGSQRNFAFPRRESLHIHCDVQSPTKVWLLGAETSKRITWLVRSRIHNRRAITTTAVHFARPRFFMLSWHYNPKWPFSYPGSGVFGQEACLLFT